MERLFRLGPCALLAASALSCGRVQGSGPRPEHRGSRTGGSAPVALVSRWQPVALVDPRASGGVTFPFATGELFIEESGSRWFFPKPEGAPLTTAWSDEEPAAKRAWDGRDGLVVVTRDGRVVGAKEPLGPFLPLTKLPDDAVLASVRRFHGATTVRTRAGFWTSGDGETFVPVPGIEGYELFEAVLDAAGTGLGLFVPERVALTTDRGATWTPVPTPLVSVQSLHAEGDRILLRPGGVRDGFARAIDPQTGELERVVTARPEPSPPPRRRGRRAPWNFGRSARLPRPSEKGAPPGELVAEGGFGPVGRERAPALDGDEVLVFGEPWRLEGEPYQPFARGRLGERLEAFPERTLTRCWVEASALCGELAAVLCGSDLHLFRGREFLWKRHVANARTLAFDGEGGLWSAGRGFGPTAVELVRHDVGTETKDTRQLVEGLGAGSPVVVGGCHAKAQWLVGAKGAARFQGGSLGEVLSLPRDRKPVGVDQTGKLVTSSGRGLFFSPGDEQVSMPAHLDGHVSFADDGAHALFVMPSGQLRQSSDGGRTFRTILTPPVTTRLPVLCGAQRCILGRGAKREGWEPGPSPPDWPEPAPDALPEPHRAPDAAGTTLAMTCRKDGASFVGGAWDVLSPRLGQTLFAAAGTTDAGVAAAFFGDVAGRLATAPLGGRAAEDSGETRFTAGAVGLVRAVWEASMVTTARFRWDAKGPLQTLRTGRTSPVREPPLFAERGFANIDQATSELWLFGQSPPASRFVPLDARGLLAGVVHQAKDGRWLVAMGGAEGIVRLAAIPRVELPTVRDVLVAGGERLEHAVGILDENGPALVLLEGTPDGGSELRARALSADLALGSAEPIPGTRTPEGRLLRLPTCAADAPGQLVRAEIRGARSVEIGDRIVVGRIVRLLRVSLAGACVERTLLSNAPHTAQVQLVVAGDGGLAASAPGAAGLRCDPLLSE